MKSMIHDGTLMAAGELGKTNKIKQIMEVAAPTRQTGLPQRASGMSGFWARYLKAVRLVNR